MNGLDIAIIAVAVLGALSGVVRGVLRMVTSLVALVASIYLAAVYYPIVSKAALHNLGVTPTIAAAMGYAAVFLLIFVVIQAAGSLIARLMYTVNLGWADNLAGAVAGAAVATALMGLILMILTAVLPLDSPLLAQSQLAPRVLAYTDMLLAYIPPEVKTVYDRKRRELARYWMEQALGNPGSPTPTSTP